jgi:hypothetical protein
MNVVKFALWAYASAVLAGCYTYAPATLETVPAGAKVRALLSTEAQVDLRDRVGIDARELEGSLVERDESKILLAVRVPPPATGFSTGEAVFQRIDIARQDVLRVDVRKVDGPRTALFIGGIAAAATAGVAAALQGSNPGDPGGNGPGPEESRHRWFLRVPVVRF